MEVGNIGSVMVVGGGIGGIQAALDLADSGFKVYLVEKTSSIGGVMAQLDKTFPTNDCSMCILAPKLVSVARHPNIEIITNANIERLSGDEGDFTVTVRKHARYVDEDKCTGCGDCAGVCPIELPNDFDEGLSLRNAIYRLYPQAVPNAFKIDRVGIPPCKDACPAGLSGQAYAAFITHGKFQEALAYVRSVIPFPSVCGRVCHHPCEESCNRKDIDEPIAIMHLKRYLADWARTNEEPVKKPEIIHREKVAVIGGGPAGLTCASRLLTMGYPVTVFDRAQTPGGMMTSCIPEYRLLKDNALYDIQRLLDQGIEYAGRVSIGKERTIESLKADGFKAIFLGIGAQCAKKLRVEGSETAGVHYGIPFLKQAKSERSVERFGKKIVVIGGGNVAIDCARTAFRLGAAEVHLVCLETRDLCSKDRMPAHEWEIVEAEEEGVQIHHSLGPQKILAEDGRIVGLETIECISVYDEEGKFSPRFNKECVSNIIGGDTIIIAIGQEPDIEGFEGLEWNPGHRVKVDPLTMATSAEGIFAGGDIVRGPASVVEAIADGREAAISIDRFLKGDDLHAGRGKVEYEIARTPEDEEERKERQRVVKTDPLSRRELWSEIERGFTEPEARREAERCLECGICSSCFLCLDTCKAAAIDYAMQDAVRDIQVGSIILAPGFDEFDARRKAEYGYGRYKNVVTSIEFERILSASGPYQGHILRPGDQKPPRKIAFLQCVGSRDPAIGFGYCSSVCCTYAIKEAIIAKEHAKEALETVIFYMDVRTVGKGFEAYYERAKSEYGVKFVRAGVSEIIEDPLTGDVLVRYENEEGEIQERRFDMLVLSVGLAPANGIAQVAKKLRVNLDTHGFCRISEFAPSDTLRDGIFACGVFTGPKDIPATVTQASAAAAKAMALLASARNTQISKKELPPEIDVSSVEPRVGVFICHCGINIGGYVAVPDLVEYAKGLPNVVYAEDNLYTCSQDTQSKITELIKEHQLNRVVVASCTPRTHEPLFRETIRAAGLNPYLFEMANIRDQCSWIHMGKHDDATEKARILLRMAISKVRLLRPLQRVAVDVTQKALVIGGGIAGMVASLTIAEQGFEVFLVEREKELGGHARHIYYTIQRRDVQDFLRRTIERLKNNDKIHVLTECHIESISGFVGNYVTEVVNQQGSTQQIKHGVTVVATGAREYQANGYPVGKNAGVITQKELEKAIAAAKSEKIFFKSEQREKELVAKLVNAKAIVMLQCVGSRDSDHPYCSGICCTQAVKNALLFLEMNPDTTIYMLYRDVRTYGYREEFYQRAREAGIVFIRYDDKEDLEFAAQNGKISVSCMEHIIGENIQLKADCLVLSTGIVPGKDNSDLAQMLKVPLNKEGFFLEAHVKLRPVDFATEGVFVAGMAHNPKSIEESISQAEAVAARAATIIAHDKYYTEATVSHVNEEMCAGCGICRALCPYEAIEIITEDGKQRSNVNEALCKGCGTCVAACPSGAMDQYGYTNLQIMEMIKMSVPG